MIRYTKAGEGHIQEKWILRTDNATEEELSEENIMFVSVLELNMPVSDETDQSTLKYKGPMYFDIDCQGHLEISIDSAIKIVNKLINYGVPERYIKIYCSGGKGFHILVPQEFFIDFRFKDSLPRIYKRIARHFHEEGLDYNVYSQGKGRMWRVANVLRDNGKRKTRVSLGDLKDLTPDTYVTYSKNPKPNPEFPKFEKGLRSDALSGLYKTSRRMVVQEDKKIANAIGVTDEDLKSLNGEDPNCIKQMAAFSGMNPDKHFNDYIMQFMTYCSASGKSINDLSSVIDEFSNNSKSSRHNSPSKRRKEIKSLVSYGISHADRYKFNCGIMESVFEESPCVGCPIEGICQIADGEGELGISEESDGYYRGPQRVSTFVFRPCNLYKLSGSAFIEMGSTDDKHGSLITAVEVEVIENGSVNKVIRVAEDSFNSKSSLIQSIAGLGTPVFYGSDADVQKIKHKLFNDVDEGVGEIMEVFTCGITPSSPGSDRLVYTEPGFSLDQYMVSGTHDVVGAIPCPPILSKTRLPNLSDLDQMNHLKKVALSLLDVNEMNAVGAILGWFMISHFKTHVITGAEGRKQFPLLSLYGNAGSGKTETAILFSFLHGVDHVNGDSPAALSAITPYALLDLVSSTTTTPRVLDEYNKSKMSTTFSYEKAGEILKMAWGSQVVRKGTVNKKGPSVQRGRTGASTVAYPITSPLCVCSEQQPMAPALQQRSVMVHMKLEGQQGRENTFKFLSRNHPSLVMLGKIMMLYALKTPRPHVRHLVDSYESVMPEELDTRPKIALQLTISGLDLLNEALTEFGIDISEEIHKLRNEFISHLDHIAKELSMEKSRTEIDLVMDNLSEMAALQESGAGTWLVPDEHYLRIGNKLYLDMIVCHSLYVRYVRLQGNKTVIEYRSQFIKLVDQENYCLSTNQTCIESPDFANKRPCVVIELSKLKLKGIETETFIESEIVV